MQLLGPAFFRVQPAEVKHQKRSELDVFFLRGGVASARAIENARGFGLGGEIGKAGVESVIGKARACGVEIIVAQLDRALEIRKRGDVYVTHRGQAIHPGIERLRRVHDESLVGTKRGIGAEGGFGACDLFVRGKIAARIVCGAQRLHAKAPQDTPRGQFAAGHNLAGAIPHFSRVVFVKQFVNAEVALEFEMRPGLEFFVRRGVAGAEALGNSIGAHCAPFVMIALEPNLE